MRILKLFSYLQPYLFPLILFCIDVSAFITLHQYSIQSLLCFFILSTLTPQKTLSHNILLFFSLIFLSLESQMAYGFFGLGLPLWILLIPLGTFLATHFQLTLISGMGILTFTLLAQAFLIQYLLLGAPFNLVFTNCNIFVNLIVILILWSLKIAGRQGNRSYIV